MDGEIQVGRVLRASTAAFTVGCRQLIAEQNVMTPKLGALLKATGRNGRVVYGMTCNVTIEDDAFVRQLVAAGVESAEIIEDQRQKRQVPIIVDVIIVGHGEGNAVCHRLPPQPPRTLTRFYTCNSAEWVRFTERHDWIRLLLPAIDAPSTRSSSQRCGWPVRRPSAQRREQYLTSAGRELARLLALDLTRLTVYSDNCVDHLTLSRSENSCHRRPHLMANRAVTGASSGIGLATASALAAEGMRLILAATYRAARVSQPGSKRPTARNHCIPLDAGSTGRGRCIRDPPRVAGSRGARQ